MSSSSTIPSTQRAWLNLRRGTPSQALSLTTDLPVPTKLEKGDVLVKVEAAALNPIGQKMMKILPNWAEPRPRPAEYDLAGEIVDSNGTHFSNGDKVFGFISYPLSRKIMQGALAEYARMPADHLVIRPPNVTAVEAAGFTLAGQTAYQLLQAAHLESGQRVFINGGTTAVGAFAIQIAKAKGIHVVASASGPSEELVKRLGAEFVDYTKTPLHEHLTQTASTSTKFHAVIDTVGIIDDMSLYTKSPAYLVPSGLFLTVGPSNFSLKLFGYINTAFLQPTWLGGTPRKFALIRIFHNPADLQALQDLVAKGQLKPVVDSVFAFEDALKAYDRIVTSRAKGKVVVTVCEDTSK